MSQTLRCTLVADGHGDRCLVRILRWLLSDLNPTALTLDFQHADFRSRRRAPRDLVGRIKQAVSEWPCHILFIHRDAEGQSHASRQAEINAALASALPAGSDLSCVRVVPVRMTEAWLLIDESAIRTAADNGSGTVELNLPRVSEIERTLDPKTVLRNALLKASEKNGRRLEQFRRDLPWRVQRVGELIGDFSTLRKLPAFRALEGEVKAGLAARFLTNDG